MANLHLGFGIKSIKLSNLSQGLYDGKKCQVRFSRGPAGTAPAFKFRSHPRSINKGVANFDTLARMPFDIGHSQTLEIFLREGNDSTKIDEIVVDIPHMLSGVYENHSWVTNMGNTLFIKTATFSSMNPYWKEDSNPPDFFRQEAWLGVGKPSIWSDSPPQADTRKGSALKVPEQQQSSAMPGLSFFLPGPGAGDLRPLKEAEKTVLFDLGLEGVTELPKDCEADNDYDVAVNMLKTMLLQAPPPVFDHAADDVSDKLLGLQQGALKHFLVSAVHVPSCAVEKFSHQDIANRQRFIADGLVKAETREKCDRKIMISGRHRALVMGLNYKSDKLGKQKPLENALKDVDLLSSAVLPAFGYGPRDIRVYTEDRETWGAFGKPNKEGILKALAWLCEDSIGGDVRFFSFSGHGVNTSSGWESDGTLEAIVPLETRTTRDLIKDEDIFKACLSLVNGVKLTALVDACHSGGAMNLSYRWRRPQGGTRGKWAQDIHHSNLLADVSLFSSCASTEKAMEVSSGGVMTLTFAAVLIQHQYRSQKPLSYAEFLEQVYKAQDNWKKRKVKDAREQNPELTSSQPFDASKRVFDIGCSVQSKFPIVANQNEFVGWSDPLGEITKENAKVRKRVAKS